MKKYAFLIPLFALAMTACSSDEPNASIEQTSRNEAETYTISGEGDCMDFDGSGATYFHVNFGSNAALSDFCCLVQKEMDAFVEGESIRTIISPDIHNVVDGETYVWCSNGNFLDSDELVGDVIVTKVTDKDITLEFSNFTADYFDWYQAISSDSNFRSADSSSWQEYSVNGTVKFIRQPGTATYNSLH